MRDEDLLKEWVEKLSQELELTTSSQPDTNKQYALDILPGSSMILVRSLDPGVLFSADIIKVPHTDKEAVYMKILQANLLGQGTGGGVIGMDENEKYLTLSLALAYEIKYPIFKDTLEEFINYLVYWQEAIDNYQNEQMI